MWKAILVASIALALAACMRAERHGSAASPMPLEERVLYYPARERVLTSGDNSTDDMNWKSLGLSFPALLREARYGLTLEDTPLVDRDGNSKGTLIPEASQFTLLETGPWIQWGSDFHMLYRVRTSVAGSMVQGWIDSSDAALILAEVKGLAVGIVPRKIVIGGGESEYSVLALVDDRHVTLVDTSMFPFPDSFHPSGVLHVSLEDVDADSQPEVLLEAETIVSLRYLGATPVRWKAWLRRRDGALVPIFRYNVSFGSDAGYSYTATDRAFDADGSGMRDLVRVDTAYTLVSGQDEFRTTTVSFYPWNGSEFRRAELQDLPKMGTVSAAQAPLLADADAQSAVRTTLSNGDQLYVFDRSDTRQSRDDPASWWYKAVTKSGVEGWISGTLVKLSWIDPLKMNRAAFLGQP
ncbi:MAG: SH3 domain-containing protein [Spirochaetia bacterium]